eukprot:jgi/Phyca11/18600/fgenesh1_pg.PHYCAscaffold_38_\
MLYTVKQTLIEPTTRNSDTNKLKKKGQPISETEARMQLLERAAHLNRYTSLKPVARWDSLLGKKAKAAAKSRPAKGKLSVPRREAVDWEAGEVPSSPHFEPLRYALRVKHLHDFASCTRTVTPWTARAGTVTAGDASNSASCSIDFENATAESSSMSIAITVT